MVVSLAEIEVRIRGRMRELKYTQKDIAFVLGLTQGTVSKKLAGEPPFEDKELLQLSYFLELPELRAYVAARGQAQPTDELEQRVATREQKLALHALERSLGALPTKERRIFCLAAALVLAGILPPEARKDSQVLRSISKIDLPSSFFH